MVEQALLERFGPQVVPIEEFFHGGQRQAAVRTTSSVMFSYNPATQPIARALLAERDRLEVEAQEATSLEALVTAGVRMQTWAADQPTLGDAFNFEDLADESMEALAIPQAGGDYGAMFGHSGMSAGRYAGAERASVADYALNGVVDEDFSTFAGFNGPSSGLGIQPTAENFHRLGLERGREIVVLSVDGTQTRLAFDVDLDGNWDEQQVHDAAKRLADAGAVLIPVDSSAETAYWNPSIVTDAAGQAVVTFTLPERSTSWRLTAAGITTETMAGQTTQDLAVKKVLFGELKLPLAFTDGDRAEIVATVHNAAVDQGDITVTLRTTIGDKSVEETKTLPVTEQGVAELSFATLLALPADAATDAADLSVSFELIVSAGDRRDVVRRVAPLKPYGIRVAATASGSAQSDTTAWVEAPAAMPLAAPHLQILVGPTVEHSLLDILLGTAP